MQSGLFHHIHILCIAHVCTCINKTNTFTLHLEAGPNCFFLEIYCHVDILTMNLNPGNQPELTIIINILIIEHL